MKYQVHQHVDSYFEVTVEANSEEEALEVAQPLLENMSNEEFTRQVIANSEVDNETLVEEVVNENRDSPAEQS